MKDLRPGWPGTLGLYLNGKLLGTGQLYIARGKESRNCLHTDGTYLMPEHRRKGHGIHLYRCLIQVAKRLGATRIYSSRRLNKLSGRMWREKLKKYYNVRRQGGGCRECGRGGRFFIQLR